MWSYLIMHGNVLGVKISILCKFWYTIIIFLNYGLEDMNCAIFSMKCIFSVEADSRGPVGIFFPGKWGTGPAATASFAKLRRARSTRCRARARVRARVVVGGDREEAIIKGNTQCEHLLNTTIHNYGECIFFFQISANSKCSNIFFCK